MAVVLLQLKLAIQRRALGHGGGGQRALYVGGWLLALLLGLGAGAVVARLASEGGGLGDLGLVLVLTFVFLGWVLAPIVLPGISDETVDPSRLAQYPISARDQVLGLLLGSLVAPTVLFTFLAVAGGTFASGEDVSARLFVVLAAVVFTVLCVAASRTIQALLAGALHSRRARDLTIVFTAVLALGIYLLTQSAHNIEEILVDLENQSLESTLSWLPSGAVAGGMIAVRDGDWGPATARLLIAVVAIAAALGLWMWAIRRRVRGPSGGSTRDRGAREAATGLELVPLALAGLPDSPTTAAASQQLRYFFFRQPRALQGVIMLPIIGIVMAHTFIDDGGLIAAAMVFVFMAVPPTAFNVFAYDDQGFTYLLGAAPPLRKVLRGKTLAALVVVLPVLLLMVLVEAAINGIWDEAAPAFLYGASVLVLGVGVGAAVSVSAPQNLAHPGRGASRGRTFLVTLAGMGLMIVLIGLVASAVLLVPDVSPVLAALGAMLIAIGVAWLLIRVAGNRLEDNPWRVEQMLGL